MCSRQGRPKITIILNPCLVFLHTSVIPQATFRLKIIFIYIASGSCLIQSVCVHSLSAHTKKLVSCHYFVSEANWHPDGTAQTILYMLQEANKCHIDGCRTHER